MKYRHAVWSADEAMLRKLSVQLRRDCSYTPVESWPRGALRKRISDLLTLMYIWKARKSSPKASKDSSKYAVPAAYATRYAAMEFSLDVMYPRVSSTVEGYDPHRYLYAICQELYSSPRAAQLPPTFKLVQDMLAAPLTPMKPRVPTAHRAARQARILAAQVAGNTRRTASELERDKRPEYVAPKGPTRPIDYAVATGVEEMRRVVYNTSCNRCSNGYATVDSDEQVARDRHVVVYHIPHVSTEGCIWYHLKLETEFTAVCRWNKAGSGMSEGLWDGEGWYTLCGGKLVTFPVWVVLRRAVIDRTLMALAAAKVP